jgi:hypothetical protein
VAAGILKPKNKMSNDKQQDYLDFQEPVEVFLPIQMIPPNKFTFSQYQTKMANFDRQLVKAEARGCKWRIEQIKLKVRAFQAKYGKNIWPSLQNGPAKRVGDTYVQLLR